MLGTRSRRVAKALLRAYNDGVVWKANRAKRKILLTSIPKAGTHLLMAVLQQYTGGRLISLGEGRAVDEWNRRVPLTIDFLEEKDALVRPGDIMWGHVTPDAERVRFFEDRGYVIFLNIRDPRDVVCSRLNQAMGQETDQYHEVVASLSDTQERVDQIIRHYTTWDDVSIGETFERYRRWEESARVTTLRYERLVGPEGGGLSGAQLSEMRKLESSFGLIGVPMIYRRFMARRIYNGEGRIGRHRELFTERNLTLFDEMFSQDLLDWALAEE